MKITYFLKNYKTLTIILAILIGIIQSCQNEDDQVIDVSSNKNSINELNSKISQEIKEDATDISKEDILKLLNKHFGISKMRKISHEESKLIKSKISINDNDEYQITEFSFGTTYKKLYIAQNSSDSNEFKVIKTLEKNNKVEILDSKILKYDEIITSELINKRNNKYNMRTSKYSLTTLKSISRVNSADSESSGGGSGPKFCQQEPSDKGSANACIGREYDEFTSTFLGLVAFWSNPEVAIVIAFTCSC